MPPATLTDVPALPTVNLDHVEICRVGTWNDHDYTAADFAEVVATARELAGVYPIPIKLGHDDLTDSDAEPAIGWCENIQSDGATLFADYKNVPLKLAQLIQSGAYRGRSCEFLMGAEYGGKPRGIMLAAVSLLGVHAPAVEGMADMVKLYNRRLEQPSRMQLSASARTTVTATTEGVKPMPTLAQQLARLPDAVRSAYDAWKSAHPETRTLVAGPPLSDIQSAVEKSLAAQYPAAEGDSDAPGADGPSQNILDWFISGQETSCIVSDQDVDNLWEVPFTYDAGTDTATLGTPVAVKGTYTPATPGTESGGGGADDQTPGDGAPAPEGGAPATAPAGAAPDETALARTQLAAAVADSAVEALLTEAEAEFDKLLAAVNGIATGKPGVAEFRAMLDAAKKSMGRIKVAKPSGGDAPAPKPAPAAAANSRQEDSDVKVSELARKLGLPETATQDEIDRALDGAVATRGVVATLARKVDTLIERDAAKDTEAMLSAAVSEGRLKRWAKPGEDSEMYATLRKLAKSDLTTAQTIIASLPPFVDTSEYGHAGNQGDAPSSGIKVPPGVNRAVVERELRQLGRDPAAIDGRSIADKWPAFRQKQELERAQRWGMPPRESIAV